MKQKPNKTMTKETPPKDFHCNFKPSTADWLRSLTNRDIPTVPAVVREIVEAAQRRAERRD